jgi:hypothetical protein
MKVKRLVELLQRCDPEAFVGIGFPNINPEYVREVTDKPSCLLYFRLEERSECSYTEYPAIPPMEEVVIDVALDAGDFDADPCDEIVEPDFRPEAN